jgi:hypothetical protein
MPDPDVTVRHSPSTVFHEGTRFHVFVVDPPEPRSLNDRIRLARVDIEADPDCRWVGVPAVVIADATARQGDRWADTMLAAPVDCVA